MTNTSIVKISLKKKYILVLEKLLKLNCINGYSINGNFVFVKLRYFQNKPLFFFSMKSKSGNKIYKKYSSLYSSFCTINLSLFFTSKGLLTKEEAIFKNVGGEYLVDILFLDKK